MNFILIILLLTYLALPDHQNEFSVYSTVKISADLPATVEMPKYDKKVLLYQAVTYPSSPIRVSRRAVVTFNTESSLRADIRSHFL